MNHDLMSFVVFVLHSFIFFQNKLILEYMLKVILIPRLFLIPNQVSLFQPRSSCFNPDQVGAGTKRRSEVIVLPIQKQS